MAKGTTEDANARRVAVFRTISGQRQAAAFDLTAIRRGEATDPQIYPGDIVVVDGSSVKAREKQILQSIPLLALFGPLGL
jgi:polysaccharide export outer membrane protein